MGNQQLATCDLDSGTARLQTGRAAGTPAAEIARRPVVANSLASKRCDSQGKEYVTKNPVSPPRKSRGQPAKLDARRKRFVAILVSLGFSLRQIARDLGIDHSTISRAAQRDGEFAAALARAKEERSQHPQFSFRGWRAALDVLQRVGMKW